MGCDQGVLMTELSNETFYSGGFSLYLKSINQVATQLALLTKSESLQAMQAVPQLWVEFDLSMHASPASSSHLLQQPILSSALSTPSPALKRPRTTANSHAQCCDSR